jgi:acyl carrier protein
MAMKMPVSGLARQPTIPLSLMGQLIAAPAKIDCTAVRQILARTLGRSQFEITDHQLLDELVEDSLVREAVIMDLEDFAGRELSRERYCQAKTVRDLAELLAA